MMRRHFQAIALVASLAYAALPARAQSQQPEFPGADVAFGNIVNTYQWTAGTGPIDGLRAYSLSDVACNLGTEPLDWLVGPNPRHPVMAQNMYRLHDGRFEQIGQSWLKHMFCALQQGFCATCEPLCGGCCSRLGVGCSTPYGATRNGNFGNLGPRHEINAHLGTNLGYHAFPEGNTGLRGRIQVRDEVLNVPGARYYAEGQYVAADDAQGGDMTRDNNNASWREILFSATNLNATVTGAMHRGDIAMYAWREDDPQVTIVHIDLPDEGRLTLGYRVTDNGDNTWHYEYALHNLSSDRSAGSFSVPMDLSQIPQSVGFHDVDYHSGEPYPPTDWAVTQDDNSLTWTTETWDENEFANALRWGTMYNFRFDADTEPQTGSIEIGLFKPGTPGAVTVEALVPTPGCAAPALLSGQAAYSFAERAFDGFIDARAESSNGLDVDLGLREIIIRFNRPLENLDGTPLSGEAFSISDTGGSSPTITAISTPDDRIVTLTLDDHISLQEWTTIAVSARAQCDADLTITDTLDIGYLPGDVNNDGTVSPFDLLTFRQYVGMVATPDAGLISDYVDTNRDGEVGPFDLLVFRQLINGVSPPATRAWDRQSLPPKP